MEILLVLSLPLLEILLIIFPVHMLILVHELIHWSHALILVLISLSWLPSMLILSGVNWASLVTAHLLEPLHSSHIGSRLIRRKWSLPILDDV